ncbi:hypothetical protein ACJRO7_030242 [Eucalyptus globulus]|uniref:Uncharacterized protein n=1 Tax=Eucalyptus globulus TaxID=34317 RepID=A0ABD3JDH3_EUCGL
MAISKTALALCIMAFVVCSFAADDTVVEDGTIGYGAIRRGSAYCKGAKCLPPPSNDYSRGCEKATECRGGNGN